jgi:hypothetical protein
VYVEARSDDAAEALRRAGFAGAVVRVARPDDPAPVGRLMYAAPAGPACLLGYFSRDNGEQPRVEGRLPDGTCLPA